jgi:hypothetical protein
MDEKIYTIPVNMAFEKKDGCPFCTLLRDLENTELDLILGASMMEPDIRIETNKKGFCGRHFAKMFTMKNRLGMGLMLESHLMHISGKVSAKPSIINPNAGEKAADYLDKLCDSCYVCDRIDEKFSKMLITAVYLWEREKQFRQYLREQPFICYDHYRAYLRIAKKHLPKKLYPDFLTDINELQSKYLEKLTGDVSWFCKKFDYRYDEEPWGDSKDAVERSISFLTGDRWKDIK